MNDKFDKLIQAAGEVRLSNIERVNLTDTVRKFTESHPVAKPAPVSVLVKALLVVMVIAGLVWIVISLIKEPKTAPIIEEPETQNDQSIQNAQQPTPPESGTPQGNIQFQQTIEPQDTIATSSATSTATTTPSDELPMDNSTSTATTTQNQQYQQYQYQQQYQQPYQNPPPT